MKVTIYITEQGLEDPKLNYCWSGHDLLGEMGRKRKKVIYYPIGNISQEYFPQIIKKFRELKIKNFNDAVQWVKNELEPYMIMEKLTE
jgi:hypothetical protein